MHDAARVRGSDATRDLQPVAHGATLGQWSTVENGAKRLAVDELGDDKRRARSVRRTRK